MSVSFSVNWDYRCPFARNAHEHVVAGLRAGADWDVTFLAYSLSPGHTPEGDPPVWENPAKIGDLLAMEAGLVVRDKEPERFLEVHLALFAARHDEGRDLRRPEEVRSVLRAAGVDAEAVMAAVTDGWPRELFRKEHEAAEASHDVWGVPTFAVGTRAAFVRLMTRPDGNGAKSIELVEKVVATIGASPEINEIKHTTLDR